MNRQASLVLLIPWFGIAHTVMATLTLKIPDALDAALEAASTRRHISKSAVIRAALEEALAQEEKAADAAAVWVATWRGCLSGPEEASPDDERLRHILNKHLR